jgi:hypothetical protein
MLKKTGGAIVVVVAPFSLFLAATGLGTLGHSSGSTPETAPEVAVHALQGTVHHQGEHLGMPMGLAVLDKALVAVDRFADRSVHVVDLGTGDLRASVGREGEGPGEFTGASSIDRVRGEDEQVWIFDAVTQRLTRIDLSLLGSDGVRSDGEWAREFVSLRSNARVMNPVHTASGEVLAVGLFAEGRFGVFDREGRQTEALGELPEWSEPVPPGVLQHAFTGTIKAHPGRMRFAVGARNAGLLEIFDAVGQRLARARVPEEFGPRFTLNQTDKRVTMASGDDLRFGYVDVATTSGRIYGLFSGRTRGEYPRGQAVYAREVHVFDWSGELEAVLDLDSDVIAIAADERDGALYAVRHDPLPAIVRYELPVMSDARSVGSVAMAP